LIVLGNIAVGVVTVVFEYFAEISAICRFFPAKIFCDPASSGDLCRLETKAEQRYPIGLIMRVKVFPHPQTSGLRWSDCAWAATRWDTLGTFAAISFAVHARFEKISSPRLFSALCSQYFGGFGPPTFADARRVMCRQFTSIHSRLRALRCG
jgi:hypothetical protein